MFWDMRSYNMPKEAFMFFEQSGVKDTGRKKWWAELPLQQNHF
jgi:hypothetical protein